MACTLPLNSLILFELNSDGSSYLLISSCTLPSEMRNCLGIWTESPTFKVQICCYYWEKLHKGNSGTEATAVLFQEDCFYTFFNEKEFIRKMDAIYFR